MKWYKHDPTAFLEGVLGLDAEERGFYITIIDLLYARNCRGVTDSLVCKAINCRPQVWHRVKKKLIAKGKVRETDGKLTANRVETEVKLALKRIGFMTVLRGRQQVKQQLNPDDSARITTTTTTTREEGKKVSIEPRPKKTAVKTTFPEGWKPHDLSPDQVAEFNKFHNSALAHDRHYANWQSAWNYWKSNNAGGRWSNGTNRQERHSLRAAFDRLDAALDGQAEIGDLPFTPNLRLLPGGSV